MPTVPTESPKPCSGSVMTVIPVYNGEPYLEDTLRSLATQGADLGVKDRLLSPDVGR
jgi:hypothetical protein